MDIAKFASRIKSERINQKLSQKKLAEMTGINNTTLSRIENGEKDLTINSLLKIAAALNVNIEYLLLDYIPENYYKVAENLSIHIGKLDPEQQKTLSDIIMVLSQKSEQWRDIAIDGPRPSEYDKTVNYTEIGKRIRAHRCKNQLSQEKLAELASISTSFLGSIERGEEILSIETLFKISNALNLPVSWLLMNADKENKGLDLLNTEEVLHQIGNDKSTLLLRLIMVLADNQDKW